MKRFVRSLLLLVGALEFLSAVTVSAQEAVTQPQETPRSTQLCPSKQADSDKPTFAWRVTVASPLPVSSNTGIPITISAGPRDVTGIRLQSAQLFEKVLGSLTPEMQLRDLETDQNKRFIVAAGQTRTFYLAPQSNGATMVGPISQGGEFIGSAVVAANQKPDGEEIKLDVVMTTCLAKVVGFIVLAAGVIIGSYLVPVFPNPDTGSEKVTWPTLPDRISAIGRRPDAKPAVQQAVHDVRAIVDDLIATEPGDRDENARLAGQTMPKLENAIADQYCAWKKTGINVTKMQARFLVNATSIAIGVNTLILTNNFGSIKDYVTCLLWGLGAPIGSKAITSLVALAIGSNTPAT